MIKVSAVNKVKQKNVQDFLQSQEENKFFCTAGYKQFSEGGMT